jgi:Cu-Zn family superoxide dismutase
MTRPHFAAALAALALTAGCTATTDAGTAPAGSERRMGVGAQLRTSAGADAGIASAWHMGDSIKIRVDAKNLPAGPHGIHVHMVGKCDAPDFTTAGAHWNPTGHQHGSENPAGPHAGDLPNLMIAADGTGTLEFTLPGGTWEQLNDADKSAMMIHATADDMKTDPSGNSGGRIACGVFGAS